MNQAAEVRRREWREESGLSVKRLLWWATIVVVIAVSWRAAEIRPSALFAPGAIASVLAFLRGLFPPDLSPSFLRIVGVAAVQTLAIAVAGTTLSIMLGLPLGILATPTLWQRGVLVAGERAGASKFLFAAVSGASRALATSRQYAGE